MINSKTQLNMVIGNPLTHTQSPLLHNMVYSMLNCNAVLLAHATDNLSLTMQALKTLRTGLIAVTIPFKSDILRFLDNISSEVEILKVANTVICRNEKLFGYNTDIDGIAYALRDVTLDHKTVLILGAGGASQPLAFFLKKNNANILWLNRTKDKVIPLIDQWGGQCVDHETIQSEDIHLIVNTTPLGMFPEIHHSPLPHYSFRSDQTVFDMVYNPLETTLLKKARNAGATCISGIDMFIVQGLRQIELWQNKSIVTPELIDKIRLTLEQSQTGERL
jgi:shikimate dehydrogenase